jgi:glycosyltransferase involved in cell wall biosynthesis
MRILTALTYYRPHYSGLTIYAERQARALANRGHKVVILTSRFNKHLKAHEHCDGVEIIRPKVWFHISKGVIMPGMLYWAWKLIRQTDVVQLHVPQLDAAPIALLSKLLGVPVVLTYHCDLHLPPGLVHRAANWASNLANRISAGMADVIVTNTLDYAENSAFLRPYLHKLHPIYPPVEVEPVTPSTVEAFRVKFGIRPGERLIGMAARLAAEKGVEYLVRALPQVLERHPTARVLFVGPYQNVLGEEAYAQRLMPMIEGLGDHWTFLGVVSPEEMSTFFHVSEVTVLPSINSTESFGLVQVESLACNTPVVASELPGVRVPVKETGAGISVTPADSEALAQALVAILEAPAEYRGRPGHLIQASTPEAVAQGYETIFTNLLNRKREQLVGEKGRN